MLILYIFSLILPIFALENYPIHHPPSVVASGEPIVIESMKRTSKNLNESNPDEGYRERYLTTSTIPTTTTEKLRKAGKLADEMRS
ncbi:unnamed protein product [Caenorhabditis angaria]|uniref:Uncharacterized protein n=1 Tax=Caenorhabditis angaria TaxID=860376 RepID=A0A9P1ICP1_9PELO|nr:unnamed protein product [Caenorhabditis angaria]